MQDRKRHVLLGFAAVAAFVGCAPSIPPAVPVTGKVTLGNGRPLAQAAVQFIPESGTAGQGAQGTTDDKGAFALETCFNARNIQDGAVPGKYKVVVIPYPKGAKIEAKYGSPVDTPLQVEVPESGVADVKLVVKPAAK